MKKGVFISYSDFDKNKKESLKKRLLKSDFLFPIVIADKRQSMKILGDKVINGINEADFLIPILTKNSFQNQWVNQEIGFAKSKEIDNKIRIIPILEESLLKEKLLKGFINDQLDLSYNYKPNNDPKKERRNFRNCFNLLLNDLENEFEKNNKMLIKFKGSKNLYLRNDDKLIQFPDRYTRELFGFTFNDVVEFEEEEKSKFRFTGKIPSIRNTEFIQIKDRIYARFDNELKWIPNPDTYYYIKEINKNNPIIIEELIDGMFIGKPLIDINKIEK